jgi:A/G-specific adenine glycosylase
VNSFAGRISAWQLSHGRHDLPWQGTRDPYRIWLAEIMLQQTQVSAVADYYRRFVERFPDLRTLAAAPLQAVLSTWSGLGYYTRARNLHRCAQLIVNERAGAWPTSSAELARLPGIGRSTAAAIAAFAYGERAAILDGNVKRVLARHFLIDGFPGTRAVEQRLWSVAERLLPAAGIESYTQGLMDLGATVCTRVRPRCEACPVRTTCGARRTQRTTELPQSRPARARPLRQTTLAVIFDADGAVLLETRPPTGIWGGLMSLPEFDAGVTDEALKSAIKSRYALDVRLRAALAPLRHDFTHYSVLLQARLIELESPATAAVAETGHFLAADALDAAPLPAPIRKLLGHLLMPGKR